MRLVVSVPVLSEQIDVALPIVSHASRCRTRLLSAIIFCTHHNHRHTVKHTDSRNTTGDEQCSDKYISIFCFISNTANLKITKNLGQSPPGDVRPIGGKHLRG